MLKTVAPEKDFKRSLILLLAFGLIHTIVLLCGFALPFGIIYGPLLYLAFKSAKGESFLFSYLHIIPFLFLLFVYILALFGIEFSVSWTYGLTRFKNLEYYMVIPFSLFLYGFTMFVALKKLTLKTSQNKILLFLSYIAVAYGVGLIISGLQKLNVFDFYVFVQDYLFVFPFCIVIAISFHFVTKEKLRELTDNLPVKESRYGDANAVEILERLNKSMHEDELYRNSSISLEMLSERIKIPKHHLSHFLNTYLGKSFYQLIAEYRINYAKKRLKEDSLITIETLAYECGFNSKTSLNKYFKEVTGFAPSQYRIDANQIP